MCGKRDLYSTKYTYITKTTTIQSATTTTTTGPRLLCRTCPVCITQDIHYTYRILPTPRYHDQPVSYQGCRGCGRENSCRRMQEYGVKTEGVLPYVPSILTYTRNSECKIFKIIPPVGEVFRGGAVRQRGLPNTFAKISILARRST